MVKIIPWFLGLTALTLGCASNRMVWHHPSKTSDEVRQDLATCRFECRKAQNPFAGVNLGMALIEGDRQKQMFADCMISKGYKLVDPAKIPGVEIVK